MLTALKSYGVYMSFEIGPITYKILLKQQFEKLNYNKLGLKKY